MKKTDDERLHELFQQMAEVPFNADLEQRILSQAAKTILNKNKQRKISQHIGKLTTLASGVLVAAGLAVAVMNHPAKSHSATDASVMSASVSHAQVPNEYRLSKAPLYITNLHVGQEKGYPTGSEVIASITNESNQTIQAKDVFGVLAFSKTKILNSLNDADWFAFVNGPDKNKPIPPHETVLWTFHPVGAPNDHLALTEAPHLVFYLSYTKNSVTDNTVWSVYPIKISNTTVTVNSLVHAKKTDGESVVVSADLVNTTPQSIMMNHSYALIWFDENPADSFTTYGNMRFINPIPLGGNFVLKSGEYKHVSFHVIGSADTAYFENSVHIQIVNIP